MSHHSALSSASAPVPPFPRETSLRATHAKHAHRSPEPRVTERKFSRSKRLVEGIRAITDQFEAEPRNSLSGTCAFLKRVAKEVRAACAGGPEHSSEDRMRGESLTEMLKGQSFEIVRSRIEASMERMKLGDMAQLESLVLYQLLVRFEMVLSAGGGGAGEGGDGSRSKMASISPDLKIIDEAKAPALAYFLAEGKRKIEEMFERPTTVWKRQDSLFLTIRQGLRIVFEEEEEEEDVGLASEGGIDGDDGGSTEASTSQFDWLKPDELLLAMGMHARELLLHFLQKAYEQLNRVRSMLEWDTATIVSLCGQVLAFARQTFSRLSAGVSRRSGDARSVEMKLHAVGGWDTETNAPLRRTGDSKSVAVRLGSLRRACEEEILGLERKAMVCMMRTWEQEFKELVASCALFHEEWLDVAFTGGAQSVLTFWISNLQNFQNAARAQAQRKTRERSTVDWKKKMEEVGPWMVRTTLDEYVFRLCDVFSSSLWAKMHLSHRSREDRISHYSSSSSSHRSKNPKSRVPSRQQHSRNTNAKNTNPDTNAMDSKCEGAKYEQGKEEDEDAVSAEEVCLGVMRDANHLRSQVQNSMEKMGLLLSAQSIKNILGYMDIFGSISHILLTRYEDLESVKAHFDLMEKRFGKDAEEVLMGIAQVCEQHGGWDDGANMEVQKMYQAFKGKSIVESSR